MPVCAHLAARSTLIAPQRSKPAPRPTGRDNWTVGYTPDRVVGVWIGNADGRAMEAVSGVTGAAPVWRQVMLAAHRGLPPRPFPRPPGIVELTICAEGGLLPSPVCPATRLERFLAEYTPQRPDDTHILVRVDPVRDCRAPDRYPLARVLCCVSIGCLPPEAQPWAESAGIPRPPRQVCPPVTASAGGPSGNDAPASGAGGGAGEYEPRSHIAQHAAITDHCSCPRCSVCIESRHTGGATADCADRGGGARDRACDDLH
jgi:membrane peptidoglycan carboxypeptidase